jgi:hypothetical protein
VLAIPLILVAVLTSHAATPPMTKAAARCVQHDLMLGLAAAEQALVIGATTAGIGRPAQIMFRNKCVAVSISPMTDAVMRREG